MQGVFSVTTAARYTETVRARIEPELKDAIQRLKERDSLTPESRLIRNLIEDGLRVAAARDEGLPVQRPRLTREKVAIRAEVHMETLSDLLAQTEMHDPEGAVMLADLIADSTARYAAALRQRVDERIS